jgi:2',3'-cyclic-nucleotide 2'-phosphodiesterase (5'-nucleotidase family)
MEKKRFGGKILILLLAALFMWASCEGPAGPTGPAGPQGPAGEITVEPFTNAKFAEINLISFNDFHGSVDKSASNSNPGADRFSAVALELMKNFENPALVAAGDNYQGSPLSNEYYGEPVSEMMRYLGVKYSAVGNHEFDWSIARIRKFAKDGGITFLAANIFIAGTENHPDFCQPYGFMEVGGVRIGLIGLTTVETPAIVKAEYVAGLEFRAPGQWLTDMVTDLKTNKDCGLVIALTHMPGGANPNLSVSVAPDPASETGKLASGNHGLDAIIGGHQHTLICGEINGVPIVVGAYNGRGITRLNIKYVRDEPSETVITPYAHGQNDVNGGYNYGTTTPSSGNGILLSPTTTVDDYAKIVIDYYDKKAGPIFDEVLGKYGVAITSRDEQAAWANKVVYDYIERNTPANDHYILFQNYGGWRDTSPYARQPTDDVTYRYLVTLMPFDNEIYLLEMKGSDILYMLDLPVGGSTPPYLVSSAVVTGAFKDSDDIWKLGSASAPGVAINAGTTYKVSCNDFMLTGGDNFPFPGVTVQGHTSEKIVEPANMGMPLRDAMVIELRWRASQ